MKAPVLGGGRAGPPHTHSAPLPKPPAAAGRAGLRAGDTESGGERAGTRGAGGLQKGVRGVRVGKLGFAKRRREIGVRQ